jgi:hypothetical protein
MAYTTNYEEAANRHFHDGRKLEAANRYDGAGYHFGFAAECALKECLIAAGVRTDDASIWKHYPALPSFAILALQTRSAAPLRTVLEKRDFLQHWSTDMRYASNGSISQARSEKWRNEANEAIGLLL